MSIAAAALAAMPPAPLSIEPVEIWSETIRARALLRAKTPPPRLPRRVLYAAALIGILVHVAFFVALYFAMKTKPIVDTDVMQVELIAAPATEPALPEPASKPAATPAASTPTLPQATRVPTMAAAPRISSPTRASTAPSAATPTASSAPAYRAYNADGSLNIPKDLVEQIDADKPQPNFIAQSTAPSPIMLPHRPLKIRPNYFAKSWVHARNENLLSASLSKLNDLTESMAKTKEFTTPSGDKISCSWIVIIAGCSWGFPPPPGGHPIEPWKPATALDEY